MMKRSRNISKARRRLRQELALVHTSILKCILSLSLSRNQSIFNFSAQLRKDSRISLECPKVHLLGLLLQLSAMRLAWEQVSVM